jgi:hypothetical protein
MQSKSDEVFDKNCSLNYFDREENVQNIWKEIEHLAGD